MYIKLETFFVMGLSRSGTAAAEFLLEKQARVYIYDDVISDGIAKTIERLSDLGAIEVKKEEVEEVCNRCSVLVLSPGIPIDNPVPVLFRKEGKSIVGESELAALFVHAVPIAVTGTNGKTTTVTMIDEVLKADGKNSIVCGNSGTPYLNCRNMGEDDFCVVEVSSFQLETLVSLKPHIAMVLNITEDHLNRHYNMENYIFLKSRILKNCTESEYVVLNADDQIVSSFAEKTKARVKYFSIERKVDGAYLEGTDLCYCEEKIMSVEELSVTGKHNVQNALACICSAKILGVDDKVIADALKKFKGIRHRIDLVDEVNGIRYIDDSKGTNIDSTLKAVACMKSSTILLLGGKDKGYDFIPLFERIKNSSVIHCIIYGENRFRILSAASRAGYRNLTLCEKFVVAFKIANMIAVSGQCVLLSPASASFDEFSSYEERGDAFVKLVKELPREEKTDEKAIDVSSTKE